MIRVLWMCVRLYKMLKQAFYQDLRWRRRKRVGQKKIEKTMAKNLQIQDDEEKASRVSMEKCSGYM